MPVVSGWRIQSSGVVIERYWWMRASCSGWANISVPSGLVGSGSSPPSASVFAVPASIARSCASE